MFEGLYRTHITVSTMSEDGGDKPGGLYILCGLLDEFGEFREGDAAVCDVDSAARHEELLGEEDPLSSLPDLFVLLLAPGYRQRLAPVSLEHIVGNADVVVDGSWPSREFDWVARGKRRARGGSSARAPLPQDQTMLTTRGHLSIPFLPVPTY